MLAADVPSKFPIPFANAAGAGFIRVIPTTPPVEEGAASLQEGFPPPTFDPIAAGGIPPFGQDFNGLLKQITGWSRWCSAGAPVIYDATFQAAIAGYPQGAMVQSATTVGRFWISTADANVTDPDAAGAGWTLVDLITLQATLVALAAAVAGAGATPGDRLYYGCL